MNLNLLAPTIDTSVRSGVVNLNLLALTIDTSVRSGVVNLNLLVLTIDASVRSGVVCECGEEKRAAATSSNRRVQMLETWINISWLDFNELKI